MNSNTAQTNGTKILICVELPNQIRTALKLRRRIGPANCTLLALTPHVEYNLEQQNLPFVRPEDYHSEDEINGVGFEDFATLDEFCECVDRLAQGQWQTLKEYDIKPGRLNWYYLKVLFNSVSTRAFILRRVLEAESPSQVIYFGTKNENVGRDLFFMRESAWSRVIPLSCDAQQISHESLGQSSDPSVLNRPARVKYMSAQSRIKGFRDCFHA